MRYVLQYREVVEALLRFCLPDNLCNVIDMETLQISDDSFVDERLQEHLSDICYTAKINSEQTLRLTLLFEHKSEQPDTPLMAQLQRYVSNIWASDLRQRKALSLVLPIVLYHGNMALKKETPKSLFPKAPEVFLSYLPTFDYIMLDVRQIPDWKLDALDFQLLRMILKVLKYARDEDYVAKHWEKIVIFAPAVNTAEKKILVATVLYMNFASKAFNSKIIDMTHKAESAEESGFKPYLLELYEEGMEKGMMLLIKNFLESNPDWTDNQIASAFKVESALVAKARSQKGQK